MFNTFSCLSSSSRPELLEQLWKARAEKKKLRKTIREFEEDFYQHNGRWVETQTVQTVSVTDSESFLSQLFFKK